MNHTFGLYDLISAIADAIGVHDSPATRTRLARIFAEHSARLDATGNRRRRPVAVLAHDICVRFRAGEWRD